MYKKTAQNHVIPVCILKRTVSAKGGRAPMVPFPLSRSPHPSSGTLPTYRKPARPAPFGARRTKACKAAAVLRAPAGEVLGSACRPRPRPLQPVSFRRRLLLSRHAWSAAYRMSVLQKPLNVYITCSLYASVQGIDGSPFLPQGTVHRLRLHFYNSEGRQHFRLPPL